MQVLKSEYLLTLDWKTWWSESEFTGNNFLLLILWLSATGRHSSKKLAKLLLTLTFLEERRTNTFNYWNFLVERITNLTFLVFISMLYKYWTQRCSVKWRAPWFLVAVITRVLPFCSGNLATICGGIKMLCFLCV